MLANVATFALEGISAREITVEVDVRPGLPAFAIVGLPDAAVREARERVRAALLNSGFDFPLKRLTANLAPADVRKAGPSFDLALALALLAASGQLGSDHGLSRSAVCGEVSLAGRLRPVRGALAVAAGARSAGYERLIVPLENAGEAALVTGIEVLGVEDLGSLVELIEGKKAVEPAPPRLAPTRASNAPDLTHVRGQADARRALEIAAAGGHNLLMVGPPGMGKTMLARCLPGILTAPDPDEALEITGIRSVAGLGEGGLCTDRPFRAPHHTISPQGLVGGGSSPRPGEVTLAHRGVLFLDELGEFSRASLDALRQPLEDGFVEITRGQRTLVFPARAMLVAACNPCPCGRPGEACRCNEIDQLRYARRLSGPLLDRIDLICAVGEPPPVASGERAEASSVVRARVADARERQAVRLVGTGVSSNAAMDARLTQRSVAIRGPVRERLVESHRSGALSGRGHDRVLRVARTIADLDGRGRIAVADVAEALSYRATPAIGAAA